MTSKTIENDMPTIEEFDTWTDETETKALQEFAGGFAVKHVIKNGEFWALTPGNGLYKLPLALSIHDYAGLSSASDTESIEALTSILRVFAGDEQAEQLEHEPIQVVMNILMQYGDVIAKTQGVSELGK